MSAPVPQRATDDEPIFHLALPDDWAGAFTSGEYRMSTRGVTLEQEGFIHCSTRAQVEATADRFYGDLDQLVVLTIDPQLVPSPIRWEPPAPGVDTLFPHIYGPLAVAAVTQATMWLRADGARWTGIELGSGRPGRGEQADLGDAGHGTVAP